MTHGAFGQCQLTTGTDLLWAKVTNSQTGWSFCRCENYDSSLNPFGDDDEDGDVGGGGGDTIVAGRNDARPARPRRKPRLDCKPKYLQMRHCVPVVHWLLPCVSGRLVLPSLPRRLLLVLVFTRGLSLCILACLVRVSVLFLLSISYGFFSVK